MNKFEQISSDDHQMLLGGWDRDQEVSGLMPDRGRGMGALGPKSDVQGGGQGQGVGCRSDVQGCWGLEAGLYSEVQCIMGSAHMGPALM